MTADRRIICESCGIVTEARCDCLGFRYLCVNRLKIQISEALQRHPKYSNRRLADMIGCSEFPVRQMRAELEDSGAIEIAPEREGLDGKTYHPNRYGAVIQDPFESGEAQFDAQAKTNAAMLNLVAQNEAVVVKEMEDSAEALRKFVDIHYPLSPEIGWSRRRKRPWRTAEQRKERQRKWTYYLGFDKPDPERFRDGAMAIFKEFEVPPGTWHGFGDAYYNVVTLKRIRERVASYVGRLENRALLIMTCAGIALCRLQIPSMRPAG